MSSIGHPLAEAEKPLSDDSSPAARLFPADLSTMELKLDSNRTFIALSSRSHVPKTISQERFVLPHV